MVYFFVEKGSDETPAKGLAPSLVLRLRLIEIMKGFYSFHNSIRPVGLLNLEISEKRVKNRRKKNISSNYLQAWQQNSIYLHHAN